MIYKVLISANSLWNIYNFRLGLIKMLLKNKYKVIIVAPYEENYSQKLISIGCIYSPISIDRKSLSPLKDIYLWTCLNLYFQIKSAK